MTQMTIAELSKDDIIKQLYEQLASFKEENTSLKKENASLKEENALLKENIKKVNFSFNISSELHNM
jgi:cell division protein FtsB